MPQGGHRLHAGTDENQPCLPDGVCELAILAEIAVTWVNGIGLGRERGVDQEADVEKGILSFLVDASETNRFVGIRNMS